MSSGLKFRPGVSGGQRMARRRTPQAASATRGGLAGHSGLHSADGAVRQRAAGAVRVGAGRHAAARGRIPQRSGARGAGGLWPGRRRSLFRRRSDDPAQPGGSERRRAGQAAAARSVRRRAWWLGQGVRTPTDACRLAFKDATLFTAFAESRFLVGSEAVYARFARRFQREAHRHWRGVWTAIERARQDERAQFGETVYLLEPNVKRSPGGLRDMQLIRWLGFARYGQSDPDSLQRMGAISKEDRVTLRSATEFLLRVRNEFHFHAGKAQDVLGRTEQVRIAAAFGYAGSRGHVAGRTIHAGIFPAYAGGEQHSRRGSPAKLDPGLGWAICWPRFSAI